ncbi:hypothetical protein ACH5RR_004067 [Cinchona calisaya]|uniref:CRM domain-containing protein n=1 Tax=Cinchona calisaya TaxID=153742 RepID=A0ABD3AWN2_9GENT
MDTPDSRGRNKERQGLALAMVNLWEKSSIAKIAIKCSVQNSCNERMAEGLKVLTGGTLLSRNKEYVVFYRGNDFLSSSTTALVEKEKETVLQQDEEEKARHRAAALIRSNATIAKQPLAVARHASRVKFLEKKLAIAKGKITVAEKALSKLQENLKPAGLSIDLEALNDEERFLLRRMGLSMKPYLHLDLEFRLLKLSDHGSTLKHFEALKHHVSELREKIEKLKSELEDMKAVEEIDEETLYSRVDNASNDDQELEEDEDKEAYHKTHEISSENGTT